MSRRNRYKRQPLPPLVTVDTEEPIAPAVIVPSEPEWVPTLTMNRLVAQARREMGEKRWQELNAEWV